MISVLAGNQAAPSQPRTRLRETPQSQHFFGGEMMVIHSNSHGKRWESMGLEYEGHGTLKKKQVNHSPSQKTRYWNIHEHTKFPEQPIFIRQGWFWLVGWQDTDGYVWTHQDIHQTWLERSLNGQIPSNLDLFWPGSLEFSACLWNLVGAHSSIWFIVFLHRNWMLIPTSSLRSQVGSHLHCMAPMEAFGSLSDWQWLVVCQRIGGALYDTEQHGQRIRRFTHWSTT